MYMSDRATDIGNRKNNNVFLPYNPGMVTNPAQHMQNMIDNLPKKPSVSSPVSPSNNSGGGSSGYIATAPQQNSGPSYADLLAQWQAEQQAARDRAYRTAAAQQNKNYDYAQGQLNGATNKALQEAYINKMLTLKNLPQQLTAQGLNGGASETTLGSMNNNYANARNSLENERQNQLGALLNAYQNNMAQLEAERAGGAAASLSALTPQLMALAANNGVDLVNLVQASGESSTVPGYTARRNNYLSDEEYY